MYGGLSRSTSSTSARPEVSGQIVRSPLQASATPQTCLSLAMLIAALLMLVLTGRLLAAEPPTLPRELKRLALEGHMDILEHQAGQWAIGDVVAWPVATRFTPSPCQPPLLEISEACARCVFMHHRPGHF